MAIIIAGAEIHVRELTLAEIRAWAAEMIRTPGQLPDLVGEFVFEGITLRELQLLVPGLNPVSLETLKPSELAPLVGAVLDANPGWLRCRRGILALGRAQQSPPEQPSPTQATTPRPGSAVVGP